MEQKLSPDKIAKIQQKLHSSSLDEESIAAIMGLIAGQAFLLDLLEKLVKGTGHQRTKIVLEIAKILEIDLKKKASNKSNEERSKKGNEKDPNQPDEPSNDSLEEEEKQDNSEIDADGDEASRKKKGRKFNRKREKKSSKKGTSQKKQ